MSVRTAALAGLCALAFFALGLGVVLPGRLIDSGLENFEGRERKMARDAFFYVATY